jgi:hypothetical protein
MTILHRACALRHEWMRIRMDTEYPAGQIDFLAVTKDGKQVRVM